MGRERGEREIYLEALIGWRRHVIHYPAFIHSFKLQLLQNRKTTREKGTDNEAAAFL